MVRDGSEEYDTGLIKTFTYLPDVDVDEDVIRRRSSSDNAAAKILRDEVSREYASAAEEPTRGYLFNTGVAAFATWGGQLRGSQTRRENSTIETLGPDNLLPR